MMVISRCTLTRRLLLAVAVVLLGGAAFICPPMIAAAAQPVESAGPLTDNPLLLAGRAAETDIGRELHQEILAGGAYGPAVEDARAKAVFDRLVPVAAAVRDNLAYTLTVLEDDEPSAFALPGGYVYATTGLLAALNDDQLAGVMAHELAHTVYSHSMEQLSLLQSLEQIALVLVKGEGAAGLAADIGRYLLALGYSRSQEAEADRVGQRWAAAAGFDPLGLPQALRVLDDSPAPGGVAAYLSTHPATAQRISTLEEAAARLVQAQETAMAPESPGAADLPETGRPSTSTNRLIALAALLLAALAQVLAA
ncbi:MAG TPA: M48 family metalloprotease [Limnochordales bacterium]